MPQRSEPQILADLIRLLTRYESRIEGLKGTREFSPPDDRDARELEEQHELIEQARAALHRHVVAEGKAYLNRPRAPLTLWTGACFAAGSISTGIAMLFGWPVSLCLVTAALIITGASILIDHKHI